MPGGQGADATDGAQERSSPEEGLALCLSGGGYRAMVFHLGALIRLNEAGLLRKMRRISSVSGGSITNAVLGLEWKHLAFGADDVATNLDRVVDKVRGLAGRTIDFGAILGGILLPGRVSDRVAAAYDEHLFHGATLQDLPDEQPGRAPRFVLHATNVQTAALWRFSKKEMGDYRVGLVRAPGVPIARAVAASSAFPPLLSPVELDIDQPVEAVEGADLSRPPFTKQAILSDGGVYDNLGLETIFKRFTGILVSDGGGKTEPEEDPKDDWARHAIRILDVIDNQVRSLRKRALIEAYKTSQRKGTYWGVRTHYADYQLPADPLGCVGRDPSRLAAVPTRLEKMPDRLQEQLINWGYAVCDAALRKHMGEAPPKGFPYAGGY